MAQRQTGTLVYLRDHVRRSVSRPTRRAPTVSQVPTPGGAPPQPSPQESIWLARCLFASAAFVTVYWLVLGIIDLPEATDAGARHWMASLLVADLFAVATAVLAGSLLVSGSERGALFAVLAAGALGALSIARLARVFTGFVSRDPAAGEHVTVLVFGFLLAVAVWALSFGLRSPGPSRV